MGMTTKTMKTMKMRMRMRTKTRMTRKRTSKLSVGEYLNFEAAPCLQAAAVDEAPMSPSSPSYRAALDVFYCCIWRPAVDEALSVLLLFSVSLFCVSYRMVLDISLQHISKDEKCYSTTWQLASLRSSFM